jgi:hypothetical protein
LAKLQDHHSLVRVNGKTKAALFVFTNQPPVVAIDQGI